MTRPFSTAQTYRPQLMAKKTEPIPNHIATPREVKSDLTRRHVREIVMMTARRTSDHTTRLATTSTGEYALSAWK